MNKKIANTIGGVLIFFLAASHSFANADIKLMGGKFTWPQSFRVDMKSLLPHARTIRALDPNFEDDGITAFTGVGVKTLFDQAGISYENGITVIGADQYVGFLSKEQVSRDIALLAWEMNDQPLGQLKGGPLKIIFPDQAKVHGSCYTWYVDTLMAGPMDRASLTVQIKGRETISYTREDLVPFAEKLESSMFSIPQGCRNAFLYQQSDKIIYAVPFSSLIKTPGLANINRVTLVPFAGAPMILKPEILDYPAFVIISCGKEALHPALGGPFSIIFPVEQYPGLKDLVPESGALFFLGKIIVE